MAWSSRAAGAGSFLERTSRRRKISSATSFRRLIRRNEGQADSTPRHRAANSGDQRGPALRLDDRPRLSALVLWLRLSQSKKRVLRLLLGVCPFHHLRLE